MRLPRSLALASTALLAACGGPQVYGTYYNSGYTPNHVKLAAADGEALAIVRANPFPDDRDNAAVLATMQGRNPSYKLYFRQTSRVEARYDYKVIVSFNNTGVGVSNPCLDTAAVPAAPKSGRIDLKADFCVGTAFLSEVHGSIDNVTSANDPRFARLMGDVLTDLLTDRYPQDNEVCRIPGC